MSLYLVNKFLYLVDRDPGALRHYADEPVDFVGQWEREIGPVVTGVERTSGHRFTSEERAALLSFDFAQLYAMGAHPFLLWTLMLPILESRFDSFDELVRAYNGAIREHGYPDFTNY